MYHPDQHYRAHTFHLKELSAQAERRVSSAASVRESTRCW
jgi:hypothetical protein